MLVLSDLSCWITIFRQFVKSKVAFYYKIRTTQCFTSKEIAQLVGLSPLTSQLVGPSSPALTFFKTTTR